MEDSQDTKNFIWRLELRDDDRLYATVISKSGKVIERDLESVIRNLQEWARFPEKESEEHDRELVELYGRIAYSWSSHNPNVQPGGLLGALAPSKKLIEWNWPSFATQAIRNIRDTELNGPGTN